MSEEDYVPEIDHMIQLIEYQTERIQYLCKLVETLSSNLDAQVSRKLNPPKKNIVYNKSKHEKIRICRKSSRKRNKMFKHTSISKRYQR